MLSPSSRIVNRDQAFIQESLSDDTGLSLVGRVRGSAHCHLGQVASFLGVSEAGSQEFHFQDRIHFPVVAYSENQIRMRNLFVFFY